MGKDNNKVFAVFSVEEFGNDEFMDIFYSREKAEKYKQDLENEYRGYTYYVLELNVK